MESYSVEAVLKAVDSGFSSTFKNASDTAQNTSKKVSSALSSVGKGTMAAGALITAFGAKSLQSYGEFSSAINKAAVIGGNGTKGLSKNMKALTNTAIGLGKELPISTQEAANAMVEMARQGATVGDIKKEFPPIARAAASAGEDLTGVATTVQSAMNIWGGGMKKAAIDSATMAIVANKSSASIGDMQQVFANMGPAAKNLGFSLKDVSVAAGIMSNTSLGAAQGSMDLNHALTQMYKPSKNAKAMMEKLGISVTDSQGNFKPFRTILGETAKATNGLSKSQRLAALSTMFGTAGAKAMIPLLDSVTDGAHSAGKGWDDMSGAVDKGAGSYKKASKYLKDNAQNMTNNVGDAIDQMKDSWSGLNTVIMGESSPAIQSLAKWFANLADSIGKMHGPLADIIKGFVAFAPIIGPVVIAIGAFMTGIGKIFAVVSTLVNVVRGATTAFAAFNAVLLANPIILVVAAIAAVVAALVLFFTKTETGRAIWQSFTTWLIGAWNTIKTTAVTVWTAVTTFLTTAWTTISTTATTIWTAITTFFSTVWNGVSTTATAVWTTITTFLSTTWTNILTVATTIWNAIKTFFTTLWAGVSNTFTTVWASISTGLQSIWQGIVSIASGIWNMIKAVILGPVLLVIDLVTGNFTQLKSDVQLIWTSIQSAASSIWNGIKSVIVGEAQYIKGLAISAFNLLKSGVIAIWNGLKSAASSIWNGMRSVLSSTWNAMKSAALNAAKALANGAKSAWNGLKSAASSIWNGIRSTISSAINGAKSAVSSAVNGMRSAASSAWNGMRSTASSVVNGIKSVFHSLSNIDLGAAGRAIMESFYSGLTAAWGKVKSFVSGIGSWIRKHKGPISYDRKLLIPAGNAIMNGFNKGLVSQFSTVQSNIRSMTNSIAGMASNALNDNIQGLNSRVNGSYSGSLTMQDSSLQMQNNALLRTIASKNTDLYLDGDTLVGGTADRMDNALGNNTRLGARFS